ncbi:protein DETOXIFICATION 45, chloroplastic [Carica papaya]|uniref:protein DETOXIFICATION 45, chloroplastic n=1 Tax=Carica papaya TaxID=3649 RepID=UPI000B8D0DA7|nr:protein DETOXIFICATION 45, chloroplastic [Carica papaya]
MTITQLSRRIMSAGLTSETSKWRKVEGLGRLHSSGQKTEAPNFYAANSKGLDYVDGACNCTLSAKYRSSLSPLVIHHRSYYSNVVRSQFTPDCSVDSADFEETWALGEDNDTSSLMGETKERVDESKPLDVKQELVLLSLPAIAGQAIDPLALLMETAYIGRLGSVELGSAGVSMSIFNIISKLFNIPLLSVATSFVAEDLSKNASQDLTSERGSLNESSDAKASGGVAERKQLSSVSTALLLAVGIGLFEALALSLGSGLFLRLMGLSQASEMYIPAQQFLSLRAVGAPAFVVSLALQGIFRGFKDTKTPVFCLGIGNLLAAFLFPLLIYQFRMGVAGAAISTVISQYIVAFLMIWYLNERVVLLPPKMGQLQFGSYVKSGGFVLGRTLAVLMTMTLATSMAARQGSVAMAAHQICMQVWLAVSLLTDALAASGQTLIATSVSKGDFKGVKEVTSFVLKIGLLTGISLAAILGLSFSSLATLFTKDAAVLEIVSTGVLFVGATQPITALAFIFDGLHYGMSDFPYAARSMMLVGAISSFVLLYAPSVLGLRGVWFGLALFMTLRMVAGFVRLLSTRGPWWFMHGDIQRAELTHGDGNNVEVTGGHQSPLKKSGSFS